MSTSLSNSGDLLLEMKKSGLYQKLIAQIIKDFISSGVEVQINLDIKPEQLYQIIYASVHELIVKQFDRFSQLLYRIDIPEKKIRFSETKSSEVIAEQTTYLILKRECEKVIFRQQFS